MNDFYTAMRRYRAAPTGRVMRVGMNYLSDLIVRPGIEKRFGPLLLYRGNMNRGHAHRLWNMTLLMMAAEAETLRDGMKILNNSDFSQLCGPVRKPGQMTLFSFFGRLHDNPAITKNIEGLTEYVKSMELGPCSLSRVDRFSEESECAPWRVSLHPDAADHIPKERGIPKSQQLFYPFMTHDPEKPDDGQAMVLLINQAVPDYWPEHIRADVCQEMIVGLLSGEFAVGALDGKVQEYVRKHFKALPLQFEGGYRRGSLDAPMPGSEKRSWYEVI